MGPTLLKNKKLYDTQYCILCRTDSGECNCKLTGISVEPVQIDSTM